MVDLIGILQTAASQSAAPQVGSAGNRCVHKYTNLKVDGYLIGLWSSMNSDGIRRWFQENQTLLWIAMVPNKVCQQGCIPLGFKEVAVMYEYNIHRCNVGQHKYGDRKH